MKQATPDISVIIPHLNQPDHLRRCLTSLQQQTHGTQGLEIIVVDNESNSLPAEICAAFNGVRLEEEATPGPGPARNRGVSLSRGRLLAFIDADCIADPQWLAAIAAELARDDGPEVIGGDVRIVLGDTNKMTQLEAYECIFAYRQKEYIERQNFSGTGNLAMRREVYDTVGPFAGIDVAEDRDWGHRATELGHKISFVADMIVFHPARRSFDELYAKWDRHVAHDFEEYGRGVLGRLLWAGLAVAVLGSPLFELLRIVGSDRVGTWRERGLAAVAVIKIRAYRARRMLGVLAGSEHLQPKSQWNR